SNVAVLGPVRKETQVELSKRDCVELGISAPIRESGDVSGSGSILMKGPCGTLEITQGVIIAHSHIHVPIEIAKELGLKDKERVSVHVFSERPVVFQNVIIRVSNNFRFRMHIDFDEANASAVSGFVLGKIIKSMNQS
ncbi:MAG: PduL/EutD family phosphate acyltransferase, partial [Mobilitalea sp.]